MVKNQSMAYGCDTWGHGLVVAFIALGEWLDLMLLEVFSNLNNSMILHFYCCSRKKVVSHNF